MAKEQTARDVFQYVLKYIEVYSHSTGIHDIKTFPGAAQFVNVLIRREGQIIQLKRSMVGLFSKK